MKLTTTIVLVFLAVVVGVIVYVNPFRKAPEPETSPPWFYNISSDEIQRIEVRSTEGTVSFVKKDVARWYFEDPENIPVDPDRWGGIPILLSGPQSQRLLYESVDDLEQFGLAQPPTVIAVTLDNGQVLEVRLGDETPDGTAHYAQMGGFPQLFLIDSTWSRVLSRLAKEPPLPKWYIIKNPEPGTIYETVNQLHAATIGTEECMEKVAEAINWEERKKAKKSAIWIKPTSRESPKYGTSTI